MEATQNAIPIRTTLEGVDPRVLTAKESIHIKNVAVKGTIAKVETYYWDHSNDPIFAVIVNGPSHDEDFKALPFAKNTRVALLKVDAMEYGAKKVSFTRDIFVDLGDFKDVDFIGKSQLTEKEVTWLNENAPAGSCTLY